MIKRPSVEIALVFGSAMIGAVILLAPVSAVEICMVWTTHFEYQPFVFRYAFLVGAVVGAGARLAYCWNRRRNS
jgi:hypothetical protein